jgi:hypothetical protein
MDHFVLEFVFGVSTMIFPHLADMSVQKEPVPTKDSIALCTSWIFFRGQGQASRAINCEWKNRVRQRSGTREDLQWLANRL